MKTKKLAEMIKALRKQKLAEGAPGAIDTHYLQKKVPQKRFKDMKKLDRNLGGGNIKGRYVAEEDKPKTSKSENKKAIINTEPEQNSVMIGTQ